MVVVGLPRFGFFAYALWPGCCIRLTSWLLVMERGGTLGLGWLAGLVTGGMDCFCKVGAFESIGVF